MIPLQCNRSSLAGDSISFSGMKTFFAERDAFVFTMFYRPTVDIRKDLIIASHDNAAVGKVGLRQERKRLCLVMMMIAYIK